MKVAQARFTGSMRSKSVRCPSGETYKLRNYPAAEEPSWTTVTHIDDAEYLSGIPAVEVEWSGTGRLIRGIEEPATGVEAMLDSWGYRRKQEVAKTLGIKANKTEEELEAAIRPEIEELAEAMENQHQR